jgi:hypothetical protein
MRIPQKSLQFNENPQILSLSRPHPANSPSPAGFNMELLRNFDFQILFLYMGAFSAQSAGNLPALN